MAKKNTHQIFCQPLVQFEKYITTEMAKGTYLDVLKSKYKGENRLLNKISVFWGKHGRLEPPA
jgi:hypothetical protein